MNRSDLFKFLKDYGPSLAGLGSLWAASKGGDSPENASTFVKTVYGFMGKDDERALFEILQMLERIYPGSMEVVLAFLMQEYQGEGVTGKLVAIWFQNSFRKMLTEDWNEGEWSRSIKVDVDFGEGTFIGSETSKGILRRRALKFLEMMYLTIVEADSLEIGYANLRFKFEAMGIPITPKGETLEQIQRWVDLPTMTQNWERDSENRLRAKRGLPPLPENR